MGKRIIDSRGRWCVFLLDKTMEFKMQPVYCPNCNRKVMAWNGISMTPISALCRNCNKLVTYNPLIDETRISKPPKATTSAGRRFY